MNPRILRFMNICLSIGQLAFLSAPVWSTEIIIEEEKLPSVHYIFKPKVANENPYLAVSLAFNGTSTGKTYLMFTHMWEGVDCHSQIKNISVHNGSDTLVADGQLDRFISHEPNAKVEVSYEIHQQTGNPSHIDSAIIRSNLIHTPGYGLGAYPVYGSFEEAINLPINFKLTWQDFPPTWRAITSFGIGPEQEFSSSLNHFINSLFIAGDIRLIMQDVCENPTYFSFCGDFDRTGEELMAYANKILHTQRAFFNDYNFPNFLISCIEEDLPGPRDGKHFYNSFAISLPKPAYIEHMITAAHENMHSWIGEKIKINLMHKKDAWWSEGFTDYYSRVLAFRSDLLKPDDFIEEINDMLRAYYLSHVRNISNEQINKDFWNDKKVEDLPYYRGFALALYFNGLIKSATNNKFSLDNVMWDLFDVGRFSLKIFKNAVAKYVPSGIDSEIQHYIEEGATIDLSGIKELPLKFTEQYNIDHGFTLGATITDMDISSDAYKRGLDNGIELKEPITIQIPQLEDQVGLLGLELKDGSIVTYIPKKFEKIPVPQLDTADPLLNEKILQWFQGENRKAETSKE